MLTPLKMILETSFLHAMWHLVLSHWATQTRKNLEQLHSAIQLFLYHLLERCVCVLTQFEKSQVFGSLNNKLLK